MATTTYSKTPARPAYAAIDFDGTCVFHSFPELGPSVPGAVEVLKKMAAKGIFLILWTCRAGSQLADAVEWFETNGIPLAGINENPAFPEIISPKAYCDLYIDDKAFGAYLKDLVNPDTGKTEKVINWERLDITLEVQGYYDGTVQLTQIIKTAVLEQ